MVAPQATACATWLCIHADNGEAAANRNIASTASAHGSTLALGALLGVDRDALPQLASATAMYDDEDDLLLLMRLEDLVVAHRAVRQGRAQRARKLLTKAREEADLDRKRTYRALARLACQPSTERQ